MRTHNTSFVFGSVDLGTEMYNFIPITLHCVYTESASSTSIALYVLIKNVSNTIWMLSLSLKSPINTLSAFYYVLQTQ